MAGTEGLVMPGLRWGCQGRSLGSGRDSDRNLEDPGATERARERCARRKITPSGPENHGSLEATRPHGFLGQAINYVGNAQAARPARALGNPHAPDVAGAIGSRKQGWAELGQPTRQVLAHLVHRVPVRARARAEARPWRPIPPGGRPYRDGHMSRCGPTGRAAHASGSCRSSGRWYGGDPRPSSLTAVARLLADRERATRGWVGTPSPKRRGGRACTASCGGIVSETRAEMDETTEVGP